MKESDLIIKDDAFGLTEADVLAAIAEARENILGSSEIIDNPNENERLRETVKRLLSHWQEQLKALTSVSPWIIMAYCVRNRGVIV